MASVTRKAQSNRTARRDELRAQLLEIIERLLDKGETFNEISVERLVAEAKLARSTFYVYFEDKGDLLRAWFGEINAELESAANGWWTLKAGSTRRDLRDALARIVTAYRPHTTLMAAVYDAAAYDPAVRQLVTTMMDQNMAGLRKHIRTGQRFGFVDPDLPPAQTAGWLMWMSERGLHQLVRTASDAEVERLIDAYTGIVWNTLSAPTRRARLTG